MYRFCIRLARRAAPVCAALALAPAGPAVGSNYDLLSAAVQTRIGEQTVLGQKSPESFSAHDFRASLGTPLEYALTPGLSAGARMLVSAGLFEGPDRTALAFSAVPLLAVGTRDRRFTLDGGVGLGVLTAYRYRDQDFGGPLQFAITAGLEVPLYRRLGFTYRFMHYSDAGSYGPHTVGADLHMAGIAYRF